MHQAGVTCLDCHPRDVNKPQLKGNALCMRCHNGGYPKAIVIDPAGHGHHKLADKGGECVGCHLPVTVYMQRHPRHDHELALPDPLLTKKWNIPNACNRCHANQTTEWALDTGPMVWREDEPPEPGRARWIAAAENGEAGANDKLIGLLADANQSPYWRAVAATFLGQWAAEAATKTALLAQLKNEHPLVRERVVRSLEPAMDDNAVATALKLMLNDPVRNVRVAAAWVMRATRGYAGTGRTGLGKDAGFGSRSADRTIRGSDAAVVPATSGRSFGASQKGNGMGQTFAAVPLCPGAGARPVGAVAGSVKDTRPSGSRRAG